MNSNDNFGTTMLVSPYAGGMPYGNGGGLGFGGDWAWILLLLVLGGGWGGFGGFGMGGMMGAGMLGGMYGMDYLYPWLNNSQNINDGFRDQQISTQIEGIRGGVQGISQQLCQCCGDMRYDMAQGFNGVGSSIFGTQTAISQQMTANEIANLNRSFAEQTANAQGFNGVNAGIADLRYAEASENCATRAAVSDALQNVTMQNVQNTNLLVSALRDGFQSLKDDLCADRLDAERRDNQNLRSELMFARSQAARLAESENIINGTYMRLKDCPVNTVSVFGSQPVFTCPQNVVNPGGCCGGRG